MELGLDRVWALLGVVMDDEDIHSQKDEVVADLQKDALHAVEDQHSEEPPLGDEVACEKEEIVGAEEIMREKDTALEGFACGDVVALEGERNGVVEAVWAFPFAGKSCLLIEMGYLKRYSLVVVLVV